VAQINELIESPHPNVTKSRLLQKKIDVLLAQQEREDAIRQSNLSTQVKQLQSQVAVRGSSRRSTAGEETAHQVQVSLADREKMAKLIFYRMSEGAPQEDVMEKHDGYGNQGLKLSNFFRDWPTRLERNSDGTIKEIR
jgi:hypothetical protein